jgi:hypothetical protein
LVLRKREVKSNWMRWAEHVGRMKQVEILTCKFKGKKSLGRPRLRSEVGTKFSLTDMWCDGIDKGSLLCTVVHLHLPEVTIFLTFAHR